MWLYEQSEFTSDLIQDNKAFVYQITNLITGKQYFGKKKFQTFRRKKIKDRKNRKKIISESDWLTYFGSNEELLQDVEKYGQDNFERKILHLCKSLGESSYWEAYYQFTHHVLLNPDKYYNSWISCKIHQQHVYRSRDDKDRKKEN